MDLLPDPAAVDVDPPRVPVSSTKRTTLELAPRAVALTWVTRPVARSPDRARHCRRASQPALWSRAVGCGYGVYISFADAGARSTGLRGR